MPQSNQRGIETRSETAGARGCPWPQSNQRGIETRRAAARASVVGASLNRTSVGLKPRRWKRIAGDCRRASIEPAWD